MCYRDPNQGVSKHLTQLSGGIQEEPLLNRWQETMLQNSLPGTLENHEVNSVIQQGSSHPEVCRPALLQFAQTVSVDVVLHTPGTWVHQGGL